jgi:hypothetical protein
MGGTCAARADLVLLRGSSTGVTPQGAHATRVAFVDRRMGRKPRKTASPRGFVSTMRTGLQAIWGCARGSRRLQRSLAALDEASRKRAAASAPAMEGALGRRRAARLTARRKEAALGALVAEELGVKSQRPARRCATESVRGGTTTFPPADNAERKGRCSESSVRSSSGPGGAWRLGRPRDHQESLLKLEPRRQSRLHSITLSAKVSAGRAAWKLCSRAKAREGGDSRTERSGGCSWCRSVADVGETHLPGATVMGPKPATRRRVSLTRRPPVDSGGLIRGG